MACLRKLVLPKYGFEGGPKAFHRLQHLLSFTVVRPADTWGTFTVNKPTDVGLKDEMTG